MRGSTLFYSIIENEEFIFRCHGKCIKIPINHITPNLHLTRASSWLWKQEIGAHYSLIHFFCLGGKMSDVCKNKNDHLKIQWKKNGSWQNTQKKQLGVALANVACGALNLCSSDNSVAFTAFCDVSAFDTVCMLHNILIQYWVSTLSASIFRTHHAATERKCSESTQRFLSQLGWHIVKDSSLIIPWQWHRPASPFRLSWTTEAGVWFLRACYVWSQIGSCPLEI